MAKKNAKQINLTEEQQKELKLLEASNKMYENSKEEAKVHGNMKAYERLEIAQKEVQAQIQQLMGGVDIEQMKIINPEEEDLKPKMKVNIDEEKSIFDVLDEVKKDVENNPKANNDESSYKEVEKISETSYNAGTSSNIDTMFNNIDPSAQYDIVPLPSHGECYENKIDRLPVGFLTAYDENFITSPNLYKDGLIIDFLLRNKILNTEINPDILVKGDVDAIILFLRATSYGFDFPIIVRDPKSGEDIETSVDLSKIKAKTFTLKADENGHFEYILPMSKIPVKFKYLTRKEERDLETLGKLEDVGVRASELESSAKTMKRCLDDDTVLSSKDKGVMLESIRNVERWAKEVGKSSTIPYNKMITNRMEMQIVAINGNYDREFIRKAIANMPAADSIRLRRYIIENEPGMNFEIEVERPQNLGGGSFKTFLEWDDSVFLNISEL